MAQISERAMSSITDYQTGIPDIFDNVYNAETNPSGVISLALSENHLIHDNLTQYINNHFSIDEDLATTYNGTTLGGPRLRKAMADHVNRYFSPHTPVSPSDVLIANGVSAICAILAFVLGDPGDGVLLMRPIYGKFENDWGITAKMKCLYVDMGDTDPFSEASVECYAQRLRDAEAAGIKVRALLVSNPHNPSGICYPASTLTALMRFCATHNIHLISDEIYALSVFPVPTAAKPGQPAVRPFTSLLSLAPSGICSPHLLHVEYGSAKDFGAAGLHLGALITTNPLVAKAFEAISILHAPSGASCHIGAQFLEDVEFVESLLALSRTRLSENFIAVTDLLDSAGIPYWQGGNAGYFLWVDLSAYLLPMEEFGGDDTEREKELAGRILRGGVWLNPGQERGEKPGWFRLIFSHPKGKVLEGVRRIIKTLEDDEIRDVPIRLRKDK